MVLGDELMDEILQEDCPHLAQLDSQSLRDYQHRTIAPHSMAEHKQTMAHGETRHPQTSSAAEAALAYPRKGGAFDDIKVTTVATEGGLKTCTDHEDVGSGYPYREPLHTSTQRGRAKGTNPPDRPGSLWGFFSAPRKDEKMTDIRRGAKTEDTKDTKKPDRAMKEPQAATKEVHAKKLQTERSMKAKESSKKSIGAEKKARPVEMEQVLEQVLMNVWVDADEDVERFLLDAQALGATGQRVRDTECYHWTTGSDWAKGRETVEKKSTQLRHMERDLQTSGGASEVQGGSGVFRRKIPTANPAVLTYATTYPPPHALPPVRVPWAHEPLDERDVMHLPRFTAAQELHTRQLTSSLAEFMS
ncbi:unnamed protein product [Vitrella brassicaformis CCMP3155]|uniref:Uncharacterized protein n=1 Tax=Vitrella brassicaformis (strain CCMP3155) TaxID=1169540 RepID=A0A0G4EIJ6_VITBC|nr:unnamed protein product [Vitrella brassicaformis CCMP3155]|eukprot:CEL95707.1 unnamed protein product [Vitrella brassicaformis CCMP3155]